MDCYNEDIYVKLKGLSDVKMINKLQVIDDVKRNDEYKTGGEVCRRI